MEMANSIRIGLTVAALVCGLSACGMRDQSPVIVCRVDGQLVATAFTFNSFRDAMQAEHGQVEVEPNLRLASRSLEVRFKKLEDGRLLAERMILASTKTDVSPAIVFGLTNVVSRVGTQPAASTANPVPPSPGDRPTQ
jgi:hypothetical protein